MTTKEPHQETIVPLLCISSIQKYKYCTLPQTARYDKDQKSPFLVKSQTTPLNLKRKVIKTQRKIKQSNVCCLKINKTFDFIASNLILWNVQTKNRRNFSLLLQRKPQAKQKNELGEELIRKISEKRQKKAKLLTQLVNNYKLQKAKSKTNAKQQEYYFATQICETNEQRINLTARQQKQLVLLTKNKEIFQKRRREQQINSFPMDPDLKLMVSHELSKLWKLKGKTNAKINQFNLVNYYQRSNYQHKIKNIKITLKK